MVDVARYLFAVHRNCCSFKRHHDLLQHKCHCYWIDVVISTRFWWRSVHVRYLLFYLSPSRERQEPSSKLVQNHCSPIASYVSLGCLILCNCLFTNFPEPTVTSSCLTHYWWSCFSIALLPPTQIQYSKRNDTRQQMMSYSSLLS